MKSSFIILFSVMCAFGPVMSMDSPSKSYLKYELIHSVDDNKNDILTLGESSQKNWLASSFVGAEGKDLLSALGLKEHNKAEEAKQFSACFAALKNSDSPNLKFLFPLEHLASSYQVKIVKSSTDRYFMRLSQVKSGCAPKEQNMKPYSELADFLEKYELSKKISQNDREKLSKDASAACSAPGFIFLSSFTVEQKKFVVKIMFKDKKTHYGPPRAAKN